MNRLKKIVGVLAGAIMLISVLFSCTDNLESDLKIQGEAYLMFINAVPDNAGLNLFLNDTLFNENSVAYGNRQGYFETNKVGSVKGEVRSSANQSLLSQNIFIKPSQYSSVFVVKKQTSDSLLYVYVLDKVNENIIKKGKAYVRFLNLVPDTLSFNLRTTISSDTTAKLSFSNATFRSASNFLAFDAGTYKIELSNAETDAVLQNRNIKFEEEKVYTIWVGGQANATGANAITTYIINN